MIVDDYFIFGMIFEMIISFLGIIEMIISLFEMILKEKSNEKRKKNFFSSL